MSNHNNNNSNNYSYNNHYNNSYSSNTNDHSNGSNNNDNNQVDNISPRSVVVDDDDSVGPEGCYLVYEPDSGGRLMIVYSRGYVPMNAIGFWCAGEGKRIQDFKFKQAAGRQELIKGIAVRFCSSCVLVIDEMIVPCTHPRLLRLSLVLFVVHTFLLSGTINIPFLLSKQQGGDSNRRKYFVGWCQFIKMAKAMNGRVIKFPNAIQGVEVDVYGYRQSDSHPDYLALDDALVDINDYDAIAVVPRHKEFLRGVKSIVASNFLEMGNIAGASTTMV